jgi:hypothetical protein
LSEPVLPKLGENITPGISQKSCIEAGKGEQGKVSALIFLFFVLSQIMNAIYRYLPSNKDLEQVPLGR